MSTAAASWLGRYRHHLARMSLAHMAWWLRTRLVRAAWSRRQVTRHQLDQASAVPVRELAFTAALPPDTATKVPEEARKAVLEAADRLLRGEWETLGVLRTDLEQPDWFRDPVTGRRSAQDRYAFRIDCRREDQVGNIRQIWELSRLQHLTVLATAWFLTHDERYARRVAGHLRSWWRENPFLSGVHWTSGMELGIRLISLAWIRRLLNDWQGVADMFERDAFALRQIHWHQHYLAAFTSRGSSADNHTIAEAAGQLVASCVFPWFPESERWRRQSAHLLERELIGNIVLSSTGRELASDSQCFIVELAFAAAVEAGTSGYPLGPATWARLCALADGAAALVDVRFRPPCPCGPDEGRGLLLDAPAPNRQMSMLALAEALVGQQDWWPRIPANATSSLVGALAGNRHQIGGRPSQRPSRFADAGITLLRTSGENEIWCRCDGAPSGSRRNAPHAHADALSLEVRCAGIDILADLGTLCGGRSKRRARTRDIEVLDYGDMAKWTAEHNECASLYPPIVHSRSVLLDRASRSIDIVDQIHGDSHDVRLAFRLGPDVRAELEQTCAVLAWPTAPAPGAARLELPSGLRWSLHRGETGRILGEYPNSPGRLASVVTLLGCGRCATGIPLITRLEFQAGELAKSAVSQQVISWITTAALPDRAPEIQAEAL